MRPAAQLLIGLCLVVFLSGCAGWATRQRPVLSFRAERALAVLAAQEASAPSASKGLGKIILQTATRKQSLRLAWLVKLPDKIRVEVLAPTGQSLLTFATDGTYVYFLPHGPEAQLTKKHARNIYLEHLTGLPVRIEDLLSLLSGRFPLRPYDTATVDDGRAGKYVLALKKNWQGVIQAVYFDAVSEIPYSVEVFNNWGNRLAYRATVRGWQQVEEARLPREIFLESGRGETATLIIRRFWVEADIADDKFVLTDPKQAGDDH
jgi:outer membrane lipoprotein-sorting protein